MELNDIIDILCKIENKHYILHRYMDVDNNIKVFKKFIYKLYVIEEGEKKLLITYQNIVNLPSEYMEVAWQSEDRIFLGYILRWFKYGDESISDSCNRGVTE